MSDITIIEDPAASMLSEPIKIAILDLLNKKEMTISEISRKLKTNKAKISYHMKLLRRAGLVFVSREEEHKGMRFKYFRATHKVLIPDTRSEMKEEKKVALRAPIKTFIDGYLAGTELYPDSKIRLELVTKLLEPVTEEILKITGKYSSEKTKNIGGDELRSEIYAEAVKNILNRKEFASLLKKPPE